MRVKARTIMSKITISTTRLGGASSNNASCADGPDNIPYIAVKQIRSKINGKLKYVHADCPEHKHVRSIARKSEKFVQEIIFNHEVL